VENRGVPGTRKLVPHQSLGVIDDPRGSQASTGDQELTAHSCLYCGAEHDPATSPCRVTSLVGRTLRAGIRVRESLGDTPVGTLYRAEYPTGLEVAVLFLGSASADHAALAVLRQRFRQAIQIQHPNVAAIHELSETHDGLVYVVAEYLAGELLGETLATRGALPLQEATDLFLQAAAGLQAAHTLGWAHGNLSPETILVTQDGGGRPLIKLIGFTQDLLPRRTGAAERPDEPEVSPAYASPERLAGRPPDERSDVFSLGAVFHHLLTGVPPTLASEGDWVPASVRAALDRALAPSPGFRFQTVAEFVAAVAPREKEMGTAVPQAVSAAGGAVPLGAAVAALVVLAAGVWVLWGIQGPSVGTLSRTLVQESGSMAVLEPDSSRSSPGPAADSGSAEPVRRDSAAARLPADSSAHPPRDRVTADSVSGSRISPFRRSHPWVAITGERFYYRSSCSIALESRDLLYFTSKEEARASGFVPARIPGCQ
jgi:serine/threonine protein kinase